MLKQPTLLCFPPAGVGPSLFRPWAHPSRDAIRVLPVAMPGREGRFNDPLPKSIDSLADALAEELEPQISDRYAIFGYSMGALLGYEIGRRWVRWGLPGPETFFVLACNAPDRMLIDREPFHTMDDSIFRQALLDLGGIQTEILDNSEAMALFEPVLRNDFRICETYRHDNERGRLTCGAHVFVADDDEFVQWEQAQAWSDFVAGKLAMHRLGGRHMVDGQTFTALRATIESLWLKSTANSRHGDAAYGV